MPAITATFGTVEYREGGVIAIPLNFAADVIVPSKSICRITHVSGSDLAGVNYQIIGKGREFEVVVEVPPDRKGRFAVAMTGTVLNPSTREWDTVTVAASTVTYDTTGPKLLNFVTDPVVRGERHTIRVALNTVVTGWHVNNTLTQIWKETAGHPGTPTPYKWTGSSPPDFTQDVPDDLSTTDWQVLATPPPGDPLDMTNSLTDEQRAQFSEDGTEWHGESGQYFMIVYQIPADFDEEVNLFGPFVLRGPTN